MARAAVLPVLNDAALDKLVSFYTGVADAGPRTQSDHRKHWRRWERFCLAQGFDARMASPKEVERYVREAFSGVRRETYRHYLASIAWHYKELGLPDPTDDVGVANAVDECIRASAATIRPGTSTRAKALTVELVEQVLTQPPRPPAPTSSLIRARLVLAWYLDTALLDRFDGVSTEVVVVTPNGLNVGGRFVPATGTNTCPVAAWEELVRAGFPQRDASLFAGLHHSGDTWVERKPCDSDKLHLSAVRDAWRRATGRRLDGGPRTRIRSVIDDEDDLARLCVMLDPGRWSTWRDDVILALQIWGGLRSSDIARLRWRWLTLTWPEAVLVHLAWQKNDQNRHGQTRAIPNLTAAPDLCGASSLRRWRWLTKHRLGADDPVIPMLVRGGRDITTSAYDPDHRGGDVSEAMSAPIKDRLTRLGVDPARYSSHTGRKTLVTLAVKGGAHLSDAGHHLGQRDHRSPLDYLESGEASLNDDASAANTMVWETGVDDDW